MEIKNGNWKIYFHIFPDSTIYIGITSQTLQQRWRINGHGYKGQKIYELIQQYDWDTEIEHILFASNLTREEASNMERLLIAKMREISPFQVRYNISDGGYNSAPTTKIVSQYDLEGNLIATYQSMTDAANASVGYNNIGLISQICHNEYGQSSSYQFRFGDKEKIEPLTYKDIGTPIDQFDLNGNYIATYKSMAEAGRQLKFNHTHIADCCSGKRRLCGPYQWKYHEENPHCEPVAKKKSARIIDQYTLDDKYIQTWIGLNDIQKYFNLSNPPKHILSVCNGTRHTAYGYKWKFNPNDNVLANKRNYNCPVKQYDLNNNFIKEYPTITEAAKSFNNRKYAIYDCCAHKQKTAYNYKWEFKEEQ